jgi:hypothetical protein
MKVKVVPVLNLVIKHCTVKRMVQWVYRSKLLDLDTSWR